MSNEERAGFGVFEGYGAIYIYTCIYMYIHEKAQKLQSGDISRDVLLVSHTLRRKVSLESL